MKILYSKTSFAGPISGADEIAVTYATELKRAGHETSVLLVQPPSNDDPLVPRLKAAAVPCDTLASNAFRTSLTTARRVAIRAMRTFPPARTLILSKSRKVVFNLVQQYHDACCQYLKRHRPDIVHVLTPDPGAVMFIQAAHNTGIPVVYQEVGIPFHPPGFEEVYERFTSVLPLCTKVAALSPYLAQEIGGLLPGGSASHVLPLISLDHNGTPPKPPSDVVTFGFAARLEYLKGPVRLLDAFADAHAENQKIALKIAGEGSQLDELRQNMRRRGVAGKCEFTGVYATLKERELYMSSIDVFVLPSLTEGTPNAVIEAMAHGKPIIATAVGGMLDLVTEDIGILVPTNDNQALGAAIKRLAGNTELRRAMGVAARKRYEALFTPEVVLPVLVNFYQHAVNAHPNGNAATKSQAKSVEPVHPWL